MHCPDARVEHVCIRLGVDRRNARPFGEIGPWLSKGKMGGLVFTDRRKAHRRSTDKAASVRKTAGN